MGVQGNTRAVDSKPMTDPERTPGSKTTRITTNNQSGLHRRRRGFIPAGIFILTIGLITLIVMIDERISFWPFVVVILSAWIGIGLCTKRANDNLRVFALAVAGVFGVVCMFGILNSVDHIDILKMNIIRIFLLVIPIFLFLLNNNDDKKKLSTGRIILGWISPVIGFMIYSVPNSKLSQTKGTVPGPSKLQRQLETWGDQTMKNGPVSQLDPVPEKTGHKGELERWLIMFANRSTELNQQYIKKIELIGNNEITDMTTIHLPGALSKRLLMAQQCLAEATEHRERSLALWADAKSQIEQLSISEAVKIEMQHTINNSESSNNNAKDRLDGDIRAFQFTEKLYRFLIRDRNNWTVKDGQLIFNKYVDSIQTEIAKDEKLRKESAERFTRRLKQAKDYGM